MKIILAIPTYNRAKHLKVLLPTVRKQGFHKIYVLDDNSTDNSHEVCAQYPEVKFISGVKNLGPAGNRNRVLDEDLGDVIFFLDDDVRLETENVPKIVEDIFKKHPRTAIVSASILDMHRKPANFSFEREANPLLWWVDRLFKGPPLPDEAFDVPYMSVAWVLENAFAIRSEVFMQLKGFDEIYRKFQEGPDLCKRAILAGYEVAITNKMSAIHTEPYSAFQRAGLLKYFRSGVIWYWKHAFRSNKSKANL